MVMVLRVVGEGAGTGRFVDPALLSFVSPFAVLRFGVLLVRGSGFGEGIVKTMPGLAFGEVGPAFSTIT